MIHLILLLAAMYLWGRMGLSMDGSALMWWALASHACFYLLGRLDGRREERDVWEGK